MAAQEARARGQLLGAGLAEVTLHTATAAPDRAAAALLAGRGYGGVRSFFHMEIRLPPEPSESSLPPGIRIRGVMPGRDERAMHRVIEEAFAGQWGHTEAPFDEWAADFMAQPFDPGLSLLAAAGGDVVGVLVGRTGGGHGFVNELAVLLAWRGRGIGGSLLRRAFAQFAGRGHDLVLLNVDSENETGAVGLYERVGMHVRRQWDLYEKTWERAKSEATGTDGRWDDGR